MLHICIGVSAEYVKYSAVLINSIVKATQKPFDLKPYENNLSFTKDLKEGFCFHIFTEYKSEDTEKIALLAHKLSEIYPTKCLIHTMNNQDFQDFSYPFWCQNAAMFYKIKVADILKDVDKCLFIGADLFALGDVRDLFALDLKDNLIAAALDTYNFDGYLRKAKAKNSDEEFVFNDAKNYINNDMMLINLKEWRKQNLQAKYIDYLNKYDLAGDLDVFPLVCAPKIHILSSKYNFILGYYTRESFGLENTLKDESDKPVWNFTKVELEQIQKDLRLVHFCHYVYKPWMSAYNDHYVYFNMGLDNDLKPIKVPYYKEWWDMALKTPFFEEDFANLKDKLEKEALDHYAVALAKRLKDKENWLFGWLDGRFGEEDKKRNCEISALYSHIDEKLSFFYTHNDALRRVKNHLAYKMGELIQNSNFSILSLKFLFKAVKLHLQNKTEIKIAKNCSKLYPFLKFLPLEHCFNYEEALKMKQNLTYRLGEAFIKSLTHTGGGGVIKFYFKELPKFHKESLEFHKNFEERKEK
ncbi:glycosyltransferase family 8 protein [Campylobacter upsaliensis]|uniref:glycosyltransferase family 8 protein n=1 Tax=Campylobacter upsaliensis TaxID=28080 RepID=UPI002149B223|nr:glycosyltransferase family 8 protein [Campylobacter upsaliensis]MCR2105143.1 glycosyltransferase family 8 protein [Campylobacter upsaliensis]